MKKNREAHQNEIRLYARIILAVTISAYCTFGQCQTPFPLVKPDQAPLPPQNSVGSAPITLTLRAAPCDPAPRLRASHRVCILLEAK
jgi:hypothetical protein